LAKNLAVVTLLGLFAQFAQAMPGPVNLNVNQAQAIVNSVYDRVRSSHEVAGYEVAGPHDRIEHMCYQECACLSKKFTQALNRYGFQTKTVLLTRTRDSAGIKIRGAQPEYGILKEALFNYHVVTIVRFVGGWRVVDPVVLQSANLEPFKIWQHRIETPVQMSVK